MSSERMSDKEFEMVAAAVAFDCSGSKDLEDEARRAREAEARLEVAVRYFEREARAALLAQRGFEVAAGERKSVSEVLSARLVHVEGERDAAIARLEEFRSLNLRCLENERAALAQVKQLREALERIAWRAFDESVTAPENLEYIQETLEKIGIANPALAATAPPQETER